MDPLQTDSFHSKLCTAQEAARKIKPGNRVFVGTACATPRTLVKALEDLPLAPADVELIHFFTDGAIPHDAAGKPVTKYRHRTFFVSADVRAAIKNGMAEYLPISIARVPELLNLGRKIGRAHV